MPLPAATDTGHPAPVSDDVTQLTEAQLNDQLGIENDGDQELDTPAPAPAKPETKVKTVEELQAENTALKNQLTHKETFIQRQGNEIGELRKLKSNLLELAARKRQEAQQQVAVDGIAAMDAHRQAEQATMQANQVDTQISLEQNRADIFNTFGPNYEKVVPLIAEIAAEMGIPRNIVQQYQMNPYNTPVATLIPYIRAASLKKELAELRAQQDPNRQHQLGNLPKTVDQVTERIIKTAKKGPAVKAGGGSATVRKLDSLSLDQIPDLSNEDLDRLLAENKV